MSSNRNIIVSFRNDDPSARSVLSQEKEIIDIFRAHNAPQTIAFIPFVTKGSVHEKRTYVETIPLSSNELVVDLYRSYIEETGSEAALHGYSHNTNKYSNPARREYFEFRGICAEEQRGLISAGSEELRKCFGSIPVTFVPPWNRCDKNTIIACNDAGIKVISSSMYFNTMNKIQHVGCNASIREFSELYEKAKKGNYLIFINILYHSLTLTEKEKHQLSDILQICTEEKEIEIDTISKMAIKYSKELIIYNEAGRSVSNYSNITESDCSKAHIYVAINNKILANNCQKLYLQKGDELYRAGNYTECNELFEKEIINYCGKCLYIGRAASFFLPILILEMLWSYFGSEGINLILLSLVMLFMAVLIGGILHWKLTNHESKKESNMVMKMMILAVIGWGVVKGIIP